MKIGFSLSRCVVDLLEGRVKEEDVLVIIARTNFNPENPEQWRSIWRGYTIVNGWSDTTWQAYTDEEPRVKELVLRLYRAGKLHQPRQYGAWPLREYNIWRKVK